MGAGSVRGADVVEVLKSAVHGSENRQQDINSTWMGYCLFWDDKKDETGDSSS